MWYEWIKVVYVYIMCVCMCIYIHIYTYIYSWGLKLPTDPVVCPDCNIEDAILSNTIGDIAENTLYTQCLLV